MLNLYIDLKGGIMFRKSGLAIGLFLVIVSSCRSSDNSNTKEAVSPPATPVACEDLALDEGKLSGAKAFALTEQCVFNDELHTIHLRLLSETFANGKFQDRCRFGLS